MTEIETRYRPRGQIAQFVGQQKSLGTAPNSLINEALDFYEKVKTGSLVVIDPKLLMQAQPGQSTRTPFNHNGLPVIGPPRHGDVPEVV